MLGVFTVPLSAQLLEDLESGLTQDLSVLVEALGGNHSRTAVAAFLGDALNKAVRLGRELKQAQSAAGAADTETAHARALLRSPIAVEFAAIPLNSFFDNSLNRILFPAFDVFFGDEMAEYDNTKGSPPETTRRILDAARVILAVLKQDPDLDYQENLRDIFLLNIGPEDVNIRGMALEFAELFPEPPLSYAEHYERLAGYWQSKLRIEAESELGDKLTPCTRWNSAFREAVSAAREQETVAQACLSFAAGLKKAACQERIAQLEAELPTSRDKRETEEFIDDLKRYAASLG
jgi:hypothetical protein